jgi:hypothetical protein
MPSEQQNILYSVVEVRKDNKFLPEGIINQNKFWRGVPGLNNRKAFPSQFQIVPLTCISSLVLLFSNFHNRKDQEPCPRRLEIKTRNKLISHNRAFITAAHHLVSTSHEKASPRLSPIALYRTSTHPRSYQHEVLVSVVSAVQIKDHPSYL